MPDVVLEPALIAATDRSPGIAVHVAACDARFVHFLVHWHEVLKLLVNLYQRSHFVFRCQILELLCLQLEQARLETTVAAITPLSGVMLKVVLRSGRCPGTGGRARCLVCTSALSRCLVSVNSSLFVFMRLTLRM